ncbi:hypothetical protein ACOMHN_010666 [Nucella lapillus]
MDLWPHTLHVEMATPRKWPHPSMWKWPHTLRVEMATPPSCGNGHTPFMWKWVHPSIRKWAHPSIRKWAHPSIRKWVHPLHQEMATPLHQEMATPLHVEMATPLHQEMVTPLHQEMGTHIRKSSNFIPVPQKLSPTTINDYQRVARTSYVPFKCLERTVLGRLLEATGPFKDLLQLAYSPQQEHGRRHHHRHPLYPGAAFRALH